MEIVHVSPHCTAFIGGEGNSNAGLIRTAGGVVLVDTTDSQNKILAWLRQAELTPADVQMVINTHFHSDHIWGNQHFSCPILAHRLCREAIARESEEDLSPAALAEYLTELEKSNPSRAEQVRQDLLSFRVTLPAEVFEDRRQLALGGVSLEIIHLGGHTPCSCIVWLPGESVLFSGDLIFTERYPYVFSATSIPDWIAALDALVSLQPQAMIPGHGSVCGLAEVAALREYFSASWGLVVDLTARGLTPDEIATDPRFPKYSERGYERSHKANIRWMAEKVQQVP